MTGVQAWERLPLVLKQVPQWCLAGPDKAPYMVSGQAPYNADVTSNNFLTFEQAVHEAGVWGAGIGFILRADDPFTCIDLDVKSAGNEPDISKHTTPAQLHQFDWLANTMGSYTERSRSGVGLHIWLLGNIGKGCRRNQVEVYSQERFIICTGDVYIDRPVLESNQLLWMVVGDIRQELNTAEENKLVEVDPVEHDHIICERAAAADNKDKFIALYNGKWQHYGYPSQSEADLSLMSMFTFYSKSNSQCIRLFRATVLGQRTKATRNNKYLNYTLSRIRARQAKEAILDEAGIQKTEALTQVLQLQTGNTDAIQVAEAAVNTVAIPTVEDGLQWPPGLVGAIAWFIYQSSPRPVREVSIVAALGLVAGICGKAYFIPQSGLNIYLILIARSAIGKEAMHSGIGHILAALQDTCNFIHKFVDFTDFASGPALVRACAENTSFVNVAGEWGKKLKRMAEESRVDGPMQQLRTVMTNLYQKSGPHSVVGGLTYSDKDKNVSSVNGVAYSMIGETTPGTFYDSLNQQMMEDGFLSRFTVIEYNGERPAANPAPIINMSAELQHALIQLSDHASRVLGIGNGEAVEITTEALAMLHDFDKECDIQINGTKNEAWRQMWNRAHLKVMRISALLAVADNYLQPKIYPNHFEWALDLIKRDISIMTKRIQDGDIGRDDNARQCKVISILKDYIKGKLSSGYKIKEGLQENGIIPYSYLQIRTSQLTSFYTHNAGSAFALKIIMQSLLDGGYIMEADKVKMVEIYGFHGKAYRIIDLPTQ